MESIPRDACCRALPNDAALASKFVSRLAALRDEEPARTRAPFHLGQSRMSRQRGMRASLWLRRPLGTCNLSVAYSVNAAMRAADNCHPLPDQLHPCSSFFRFPRTSPCDAVRSRKDRCVFTTPSIASAGGPVFTRENCSFPLAWCLFASLVSSPLSSCRLHVFRVVVGVRGERPRSVFSSFRERRREKRDPKRVPPMGARALEPLSRSRLCHRARKKTCRLLLTAVSDRVPPLRFRE